MRSGLRSTTSWRSVSSGRRRLAAVSVIAAALALAAAAPAATSVRFKGRTKDGGPVSFRLGNGSVSRFQASVSVTCVSAAPARAESEIYLVAPDRSAKLGHNGRFTLKLDRPKQQFQGETGKVIRTLYSVKATVAGNVPGHSAAGTVNVTYSTFWNAYNPATGFSQLTLASGSSGKAKIRWTAAQQ